MTARYETKLKLASDENHVLLDENRIQRPADFTSKKFPAEVKRIKRLVLPGKTRRQGNDSQPR
jgi:hypothetical protein